MSIREVIETMKQNPKEALREGIGAAAVAGGMAVICLLMLILG